MTCTHASLHSFHRRGRLAAGQRFIQIDDLPVGPASLREDYLSQVQRDCLSRRLNSQTATPLANVLDEHMGEF